MSHRTHPAPRFRPCRRGNRLPYIFLFLCFARPSFSGAATPAAEGFAGRPATAMQPGGGWMATESEDPETDAKQPPTAAAAQLKDIEVVLGRFNSAFSNHDAKALRGIWPQAPRDYTDNMSRGKYNSVTMSLIATGKPTVSGHDASLPCNLIFSSVIRGQTKPSTTTAHNLVLRRQNGRWIISAIQ